MSVTSTPAQAASTAELQTHTRGIEPHDVVQGASRGME